MHAKTRRTPLPMHFRAGFSGLSGYLPRKPCRYCVSTIPFMNMESGFYRDRPGFMFRIKWQEVKAPEYKLSARRKIRANKCLAETTIRRILKAKESRR